MRTLARMGRMPPSRSPPPDARPPDERERARDREFCSSPSRRGRERRGRASGGAVGPARGQLRETAPCPSFCPSRSSPARGLGPAGCSLAVAVSLGDQARERYSCFPCNRVAISPAALAATAPPAISIRAPAPPARHWQQTSRRPRTAEPHRQPVLAKAGHIWGSAERNRRQQGSKSAA